LLSRLDVVVVADALRVADALVLLAVQVAAARVAAANKPINFIFYFCFPSL
jgi:hypothetical protein